MNTSVKYKMTKVAAMNAVAHMLLSLKTQVKVFHWQARRYATHKALDRLFERLGELNDKWVETAMGIYGRVLFVGPSTTYIVHNLNDGEAPSRTLRRATHTLRRYRRTIFAGVPDLSNILDEIIGAIHRTIYLLSLR